MPDHKGHSISSGRPRRPIPRIKKLFSAGCARRDCRAGSVISLLVGNQLRHITKLIVYAMPHSDSGAAAGAFSFAPYLGSA
jgi:hypothetical protein